MSIMNIVLLVISLVMFVYGLYLWGRILIPKWAEKDIFFSSPKLGRIKARRRNGRIISFFDNLVGKKKHVNPDTGKIEETEVTPKGFWWRLYGVRFIGLDDVYQYKIATGAVENMNSELEYTEDVASSIFLEGLYPLTVMLMTQDGVRLKVKLQLTMSTVNAAKALSLPISWTKPVFAAVIAASRDFFGARKTETLITSQNEGKTIVDEKIIEHSGFVDLILSLNKQEDGNISLGDICGQEIKAINVVDIDFADQETKKAYNAPFTSKRENESIVIKSEAELKAAKNRAKAKLIEGAADVKVYGEKHRATGSDSRATAQILTAEKQAGMTNLNSLTNVSGEGRPPVAVSLK